MEKLKPIKPSEVLEKKSPKNNIPQEVINAFNNHIAEKWDNHNKKAIISQNGVIDTIIEYMADQLVTYKKTDGTSAAKIIDRTYIFEQHWLDIEDIFREAGWDVYYDKPAYYETYPATFKFTIKKD